MYLLEWGTGVSSKACDVTRKQQIDQRMFDWSTLELQSNGYFYADGVNTTSSLTYLAQVRAFLHSILIKIVKTALKFRRKLCPHVLTLISAQRASQYDAG